MVDRDVLSARLSALEGYLAELRGFRKVDEEDFVREPALHHLAERYLHLACEAVADVAHHVIADEGLRQPANYKDAIAVLAEAGRIDRESVHRLQDWMGLRNVLTHLYLEIDHRRTYAALHDDLGELETFTTAMARLLAP